MVTPGSHSDGGMMGISLKEEQTPVLTAAQIDANWKAIAGSLQLITIAGGILTVNGAGLYLVETEGGAATDDVTGISGAWRAGDMMTFYQATAGHSVTWKHQGNLHLNGGFDFIMDSVYCNIHLRHM